MGGGKGDDGKTNREVIRISEARDNVVLDEWAASEAGEGRKD